jgi:amino acid transporter
MSTDYAALPAEGPPRRTLGFMGVAIVCFAAVAGGPFGLEPAVGLAGGLPTLLCLLVAGVCWAATQALMVAELATLLPSNAGYIGWVLYGLGPSAGFTNAWICNFQQALNLPLYAVLACSSLEQLVGRLPAAAEFGVKFGVVAAALLVNYLGVGAMERVAGVMVLLVQTPFVLMPMFWAASGRAFAWGALGQSVAGWQGSAAGFLSTVIWNVQGWNVLGNIAGEVERPTLNIPLGIGLAVILVVLNYVWPVLLTVPMSPPPSPPDDPSAPGARWGAGYFAGLAASANPALGGWAAFCSVLSCTSNFIPQLATSARALQATARLGMVPGPAALGKWVAQERRGIPLPALACIAVSVLALMALDFETLVTTQILLALVGLGLQFSAFLALKYSRREAARPFAVPGGLLGAWAVALPFFLLAGVVAYANVADGVVAQASLGAVVGVALALWAAGELWWKRGGRYSAELVDAVLLAPAVGGGGGEGASEALLEAQ